MPGRGLRGPKLSPATSSRESLPRRVGAPAALAALAILFLGRVFFASNTLLPAGYLAHFQPWQAANQQGTVPIERTAPHAAPALIGDCSHPQHWNALAWDAMAQYYPWRSFAHDTMRRGIIPLWNPYQFCGTPFVANDQSAVFYPPNALFYLLHPAQAFGISAALHLLLAGLFAFMFLRAIGLGRFGALFGGVTFAFCAFFAAWVQLPTVMNTAAWLPLALFFVERYFTTRRLTYALGIAFATATAALAGHPQIFLFVTGMTALYFVFRAASAAGSPQGRIARGLLAGIAVIIVGGLWGAAQLLPTAELLPYSHRATAASALGYAAYLRFAMPWQQLITLLLPEFMGNPAYGTYFGRGNFAEYAGYIGVLPLALAVLGVIWRRDKHAWFFAAVAVFALLAALGTPVNLVLFYLVPGFSSTGGPARMLLIYSAAMAFLAGMGADAAVAALGELATARRFARQLMAATASLIIVAAVFSVVLAVVFSVPLLALLNHPQINILILLCCHAIASLVYLFVRLDRTAASRHAALGLLLIATIADLFSFGMRYYLVAPPQQVYPSTALTDFLREHSSRGGRIMPLAQSWGLADFPRAVLAPNSAMVYGLCDVEGYDSLYLARYRSVMAAVEGRDPSPLANGNMLLGTPPDATLLRALGVEYVLSQAPLDLPGLTLERAGEVNVYRVEKFLPRAYLARSVVAARDLPGALAELRRAADGAAVIEGLEPRVMAATQAASRGGVSLQQEGPNRLSLKAGSGVVVVSDAYYPGWRAYVDHRPSQVLIANGAFRAVITGPGQHDVVMRFEPTSVRLGLFATFVALAMAMAAAGHGLTARRRGGC